MLADDAKAQREGIQAVTEAEQQLIDHSINQFMRDFEVPGLSIAISKDGEFVLREGYGFADRENRISITPNHRFRIASVSKPITSVAVHTLIQRGRLSYDDRVFGPESILGSGPDEWPLTQQHAEITVEHLLTHTAGAWDNKQNDPMFMQTSLDHQTLIGWTLANQPLEHDPGTHYAYSNFGYCLLGRIIEKVSGQSYESYVADQVFRPIDAGSFAIGGNLLKDQLPREVKYYADQGNPYGLNVTRMDSHGGWVATPTDLVKFVLHYDGFPRPADRLTSESIRNMVQPSAANENYAKGWSVNQANNWWHMGSLPGTGTILVRTSRGFCWAVLANTRSSRDGYFKALDALPWKLVNGIASWKN